MYIAFGFVSLGAGLVMGTAAKFAHRTFGASNNMKNDLLILFNDATIGIIGTNTRSRDEMRQILSIQDEWIAPPVLMNASAKVRKG